MRRSAEPREKVLVVSESLLLCRRVERALVASGYEVQRMATARELIRSRRQRPFLVCFLDTRGEANGAGAEACFASRPGERYVLIRDGWSSPGTKDHGQPKAPVFGCLREPFSSDEVLLWANRASNEVRLLRGDRSLDDLLYCKFQEFLRDLGPSSMTRFHDLMWERVERPLIRAVLEWAGGNQTRAAQILGIHRNTLRGKIRDLKLQAGVPAKGQRVGDR